MYVCMFPCEAGKLFFFSFIFVWGLHIGRFLTEEKLEKQREAPPVDKHSYCRLIQRVRR